MSRQSGATADQLRHDIDQGRTGDKVRFPDPAAAPLGTDEEAAGTPIDPQVIAQTRKAEAKLAPPIDAQRSAEGRVSDVLWWIATVPNMPLPQARARMCSRFANTMRASATLPLSFMASRMTAKASSPPLPSGTT
jgi:hypothetical protein